MTDWTNIFEKAKQETHKELMDDIRKLTILSENDINKIAPLDTDKAKLRELLRVVTESEIQQIEANLVINELLENSDIIMKLINKILKKEKL